MKPKKTQVRKSLGRTVQEGADGSAPPVIADAPLEWGEDLDRFGWGYALMEWERGDPYELARWLREYPRSPVSQEVREALADLVEGKIAANKKRGVKRSIPRHQVLAIRGAARRYPAMVNGFLITKKMIIEAMALAYGVRPGTIRDVIERRGAYAEK